MMRCVQLSLATKCASADSLPFPPLCVAVSPCLCVLQAACDQHHHAAMAAKEVQVQAASGAAADKDRQLQAANAAAAERDAELHAAKLHSAQQDDKLTQLMRRLEESERSHEATQAKLQQSYEVGAAWKLSWFFACCPDLGLGHQPGIHQCTAPFLSTHVPYQFLFCELGWHPAIATACKASD